LGHRDKTTTLPIATWYVGIEILQWKRKAWKFSTAIICPYIVTKCVGSVELFELLDEYPPTTTMHAILLY